MGPLSQAEVAEVLRGLEAAMQSRPAIASTPMFIGTLRLALAARQGAPAVAAPLTADGPDIPDAPGTDHSELTAALDASRSQLRAESAAKSRAAAQVKAVNAALLAETVKTGTLERSLAEATARVTELQAESRAQLQAHHDELTKLVRGLEWSAQRKLTQRGSEVKLPACPVCGGLSPEGLPGNAREVNHRANCGLQALLAAFARKQP